MMESAIEPKSAIAIVMVNAVTNRGEKMLSAYMMLSPFVLIVVLVGVSAWLFSFFSSVVNANEWGLPHRVMAALYAHKRKVSTFFFKFFFRLGARVWVGGCVGVGAWVWRCGAAG